MTVYTHFTDIGFAEPYLGELLEIMTYLVVEATGMEPVLWLYK